MLRTTSTLIALTLLSACGPEGQLNSQSLGRATGLFATIEPKDAFCEILHILTTSMSVTLILPDGKKDTLRLDLQPMRTAGEHQQYLSSLGYGAVGEHTPALIDAVRGREQVSPELTGEVADMARATRTSLVFPLWLDRVKVTPKTLCNIDPVTNEKILDDCVDVPESTLEGAKLWCTVGQLVELEFTQ
ncbi:MAG: hypothetical protein K1X89_19300 [Myxococcaceae bacterium]|nr:hypothetical protein [Myxococcaceae bacterium]